jgi:hypothetical protein
MLGIPSSDELSALIKQAIDGVTATGATLEASTAQALHDQLHASLTEVFAGLAQAENPVLTRIDAMTAEVHRAVALAEDFVTRLEVAAAAFGQRPKAN